MVYLGEDLDIYNATYEVDCLINASIEDVWKQYIDISSWVTSHAIENVHGEPGSIGSVTRVSFKRVEEFSMPPAHHHYCKIIKLIPEQQYVLKTYSEKGGSYGWHIVAFDDARFYEVEQKTMVVFNLYIEIKCDAAVKDPESLDRSMEASREGMIANLNRLKNLVEARGTE